MTAPFTMRPIPDGMDQAFLVHPRWTTAVQMLSVFAPVDAILSALAQGEVEVIQGKPVMKDADGWTEIAPALQGWCDAFERIARAADMPLDVAPMRRLAARLDHGVLINLSDLDKARAVCNRCRAVFLACLPWRRRAAAVDAEIAIQLEALGLREAA